MITCEEHDRLLEEIEQHPEKEPVGGAMGKHHFCPRDAAHAHHLLSGIYYIRVWLMITLTINWQTLVMSIFYLNSRTGQ